MQVKYQTSIVHAQNEGEFTIPETRYKADGYSKSLNCVFEFHGDYWHGNPKIYDADKINTRVGVSHGELYQQTLAKKKLMEDKGFHVVEIWEADWKRFVYAIRALQKIWRSKSNEDTAPSPENNQTLSQTRKKV